VSAAVASIYRSPGAEAMVHELYERARLRLPFPTESRSLATRLGPTHLLIAGPPDGPPVVVLHGGNVINPLTLGWFAPLVDRFRLYAPDTIGHPGMSAPVRVSASDRRLGEWVVDVIDQLGLARPAFIGLSFGAGIFLRLAAVAPERIARAALVVPSGLSPIPKGSMLRLGIAYLTGRRASRERAIEQVVRLLSIGEPDPLMIEAVTLAFIGTRLETEMPRVARPTELAELVAPILVVAAERDPLFPPERVFPAARRVFQDVTTAILPADVGHILSPHARRRLNECLEDFLLGSK
jgi:pimeloyl-ACP methyl ester carboxylesterase